MVIKLVIIVIRKKIKYFEKISTFFLRTFFGSFYTGQLVSKVP